jgi:hypothetical protein
MVQQPSGRDRRSEGRRNQAAASLEAELEADS